MFNQSELPQVRLVTPKIIAQLLQGGYNRSLPSCCHAGSIQAPKEIPPKQQSDEENTNNGKQLENKQLQIAATSRQHYRSITMSQ